MSRGAEIENKLDTLKREAARRGSDGTPGPSTAALATDLWWDIVRHCDDLNISEIQLEFGEAIAAMTGIHAGARQRDLISRARNHKGMELVLLAPRSDGPGATAELWQVTMEAATEFKAKADAHLVNASKGSAGVDRTLYEFQTAIILAVSEAYPKMPTSKLLAKVNRALIEQGLDAVSNRTMRRAKNKSQ